MSASDAALRVVVDATHLHPPSTKLVGADGGLAALASLAEDVKPKVEPAAPKTAMDPARVQALRDAKALLMTDAPGLAEAQVRLDEVVPAGLVPQHAGALPPAPDQPRLAQAGLAFCRRREKGQ